MNNITEFTTTISKRNHNFLIPHHNTSCFKRSPHYNCVILFNALPNSIKAIKCLKKFEREVKKYLISKCFYSVNEFIVSD